MILIIENIFYNKIFNYVINCLSNLINYFYFPIFIKIDIFFKLY